MATLFIVPREFKLHLVPCSAKPPIFRGGNDNVARVPGAPPTGPLLTQAGRRQVAVAPAEINPILEVVR